MTKALAQKLNVPEGVLLKQAGQTKGPSYGGAGQQGAFKTPEPAIKAVLASSGQELLLALFLKDPAWVKAARENIGPEDFSDGQCVGWWM